MLRSRLRHLPRVLRAPLVALLLAGCAPSPPPPTAATPDGQLPRVLTTYTVLADMAEAVACGKLEVVSVTRPGAEIHSYAFTPSDLERAQGAQLILANGLGLEAWLERFLANLGPVPRVVVSEGVEPIPIGDAAAADRPNPHAWMSPRLALTYVANIRDAFISLDPANEATFRECAARYGERIQELDRQLRQELDELPADQRILVTCEGAFSYLARDYGLQEAYLWPVNGDSEVTPQRMERVIRSVRENRIPAVFCESTVDDRAQRQVAAQTGARFAGVFYVDSLSPPSGPAPTYLAMLRHNVDTLRAGLRGR